MVQHFTAKQNSLTGCEKQGKEMGIGQNEVQRSEKQALLFVLLPPIGCDKKR